MNALNGPALISAFINARTGYLIRNNVVESSNVPYIVFQCSGKKKRRRGMNYSC